MTSQLFYFHVTNQINNIMHFLNHAIRVFAFLVLRKVCKNVRLILRVTVYEKNLVLGAHNYGNTQKISRNVA